MGFLLYLVPITLAILWWWRLLSNNETLTYEYWYPLALIVVLVTIGSRYIRHSGSDQAKSSTQSIATSLYILLLLAGIVFVAVMIFVPYAIGSGAHATPGNI